jgi:probable Rubsico expression protein CbbX
VQGNVLVAIVVPIAILIATGVTLLYRRIMRAGRPGRVIQASLDSSSPVTSLDALPSQPGKVAGNMSTGAASKSKKVATPEPGLGGLPTLAQALPVSGRAARRRGLLPPETLITFAEERKAAAIDNVFAALDRTLVGLVPVKKQVEEIGSLLLVDRVRQRFGLLAPRPNLHMSFTGAPGTGKTTVGLLMADLLHQLGYLEQGQLVHAMRDDLVGEYVGQTAPKTRRVIDKAMGGVLFIDEASALYQPDNTKDFGQEAIEILLQVMENERDKFIVILAGYKERMDIFFECNPGLRSRFAHHLDFADYELDELVAIGRVMLERANYYLSEEAEMAFREYIRREMREPLFANARSVRNELERARLRHAHRLAADPQHRWGRDDLMRIEATDIMASRPVSAGVTEP